MADPQSQPGAIALPELVERLQNGGENAVAALSQEELEAIIDDLPLALESEAIRDVLAKVVARIERQKHRTFRRIVEIARQDDERTPILLGALKFLGFSGEPTDEEFAWLVHVMSTNHNAMARLDAFDQALRLALQPALQAILEAVATIHPDEAIRAQMATSAGDALGMTPEAPASYVSSSDLTGDLDLGADFPIAPAEEPAAETAPADAAPASGPVGAIAPPPDESAAWADYEEKPPERLTVRTLLRSVDPAAQLAPPPTPAPEELAPPMDDEATPASNFVEPTPAPEPTPAAASAEDDAAAWGAQEEKQPERLTVRTLLRSVDPAAQIGPPTVEGSGRILPANPEPLPDAAAEEQPERETVKTALADVGHADEMPAPPTPAPEEPAPAPAPGETVETMLRSLETVRLSLRELETAKGVMPPPAALGPDRVPPPAPPEPPKSPWSAIDLKPLAPPERARALAKLRRDLKPEERRPFLAWLLERENDPVFGASIRREILEFAFERPVFYGFDGVTRARLGRWIRERAAADALTAAAILGALRRATWAEGEPPNIDAETRPIVDAASGILLRTPGEERVPLLGRDFTAWLFAVREFEDKEVIDNWAQDETPGVAEGLFRALAAMDGSATKLGVTEGPTAIELALSAWDNAHNEQRMAMANAIAGGWSRGFVLDRAKFFDGFWKRYQSNENQREAILVALASFEAEIAAARAKDAPSEAPATAPVAETAPEAPVSAPESGPHGMPAFVAPPQDPPQTPEEPVAEAPVAAEEPPAPSEESVMAAMFGARKSATPAAATASPAAPSSTAGVTPAPVEDSEVTQPDNDGGSMDRYFEQKRRELERVMKQFKDDEPAADPSGATEPMPEGNGAVPSDAPSEAPTDPRLQTAKARTEEVVPDEGDAVADEDFIPDEGEAMLTDEERASSAPKKLPVPKAPATPAPPARPIAPTPVMTRPPAAPRAPVTPEATPPARPMPPIPPRPAAPAAAAAKPATKPAGSPDTEVVLPSEPLRTLAEYTGFLRALSGGTSIDELLGRHGMDYRQYAACMTSWGKLLQSRPDLALRMGQLLRGG